MPYMQDESGTNVKDPLGSQWWIDRALKENFDYIIPKVSHKIPHRRSDMFICIDGPVGSGKTTLSFQCAKYFDPTFNLSRVVFSVDEFLKALIRAVPGQAIVFDEAIIVNSRSALTEFNKKVIIAMTQIRSKGLYIFFNIPSVFDLDRNLVLNRCHLLLHCFQNNFGDRGRFLVFDKDKLKTLYLKGKRLYSYAFPKANFSARFNEYFFLDREEYEKKKQAEIAKQGKNKKQHRWFVQRNILIKWVYDHSWPGALVEKKFENVADILPDLDKFRIKNIIYNENMLDDE